MKTSLLIIVFVFQLFLISCNKTGGLGGDVIDVRIDMLFFDNSNIDLLAKSTSKTLNTESIKIYNINGNQKIEVFDPNLDFQRNFKIFDFSTGNVMRLFPNDSLIDGYSTTLIEWNQNDSDTIRCAITKTSTTLITDSVWYNNKLEYPTNNEYKPRRMFKIAK